MENLLSMNKQDWKLQFIARDKIVKIGQNWLFENIENPKNGRN